MKRYIKSSASNKYLSGIIAYLQTLSNNDYTCRKFDNLIVMEIKLPLSLTDEVCEWIFGGQQSSEYQQLFTALHDEPFIVLQVYIEPQQDSYEVTEIMFDLPTDVGNWAESISIIDAIPFGLREDLLNKALSQYFNSNR